MTEGRGRGEAGEGASEGGLTDRGGQGGREGAWADGERGLKGAGFPPDGLGRSRWVFCGFAAIAGAAIRAA